MALQCISHSWSIVSEPTTSDDIWLIMTRRVIRRGSSKGQRLYHASVKRRLTRSINSAPGVSKAMKVTNQTGCLAVTKPVLQPEGIYHNYPAQVTGAEQRERARIYHILVIPESFGALQGFHFNNELYGKLHKTQLSPASDPISFSLLSEPCQCRGRGVSLHWLTPRVPARGRQLPCLPILAFCTSSSSPDSTVCSQFLRQPWQTIDSTPWSVCIPIRTTHVREK